MSQHPDALEILGMISTNYASETHAPTGPQIDPSYTAAFALAHEQAGFDRILISYALSMIPDWEAAIDSALAALTPGGSLHIVDFGQQERLPSWFARLLQGWLRRFHVTPRADLEQALRQRLDRHNASLRFERLGRGYAWHAVIATAS